MMACGNEGLCDANSANETVRPPIARTSVTNSGDAWVMFDIDISQHQGRTMLRLIGAVVEPTGDLLHEAFAFVRPDDHVILDLSQVVLLNCVGATCIHDIIDSRNLRAETVVVSTAERVTMSLVLCNVDRVTSVVRSDEDAVAIFDCRGAGSAEVSERRSVVAIVG